MFHFSPPRNRWDIVYIAHSLGYRTGVELGVQRGYFARDTLNIWGGNQKYYLVDIWKPQGNYEDVANVPQHVQDAFLLEAKKMLIKHAGKVVLVRNYTTEAAKIVPGGLDYVYVDARHDYCGVKQDIEDWWPKIRDGGMMGGHDYVTNAEVKEATPMQDWSKCADGVTIAPTAVRGAVDDFFRKKGLQVIATTFDKPWRSWMVFKPECRTMQ